MKYKVVVVLWEDHTEANRQSMVEDPDELLCNTMTIGVLYKETEKSYTILYDIERCPDRDDCSYMVILKSTVQGIKEFGEIELEKLRIVS